MKTFCVHCQTEGHYVLTPDQYNDIYLCGRLIQEVFPELSADEREFMISGIHPACWDDMFSKGIVQEEQHEK
jgi:hypothetical protein